MNKDKQIEEIQAEIIRWGENADRTGNYRYNLSEHLVDKGYRKASEIFEEIFEEIEKEIELAIESNYRAKKEHKNHSVIPNYDNFNAMCDGKIYAMRGLLDFIKELQEKKYIGEDTNVTANTEDGK